MARILGTSRDARVGHHGAARGPGESGQLPKGMAGIDVAIPLVGHFDFGVLAEPDSDADGVVLAKILAAHPELDTARTVLQERPDGVQLMEHDFMTEQPIKGK